MIAAEAREANMAWLMQQVNYVLEPLMLAIVREKPDDAVSQTQSTNHLTLSLSLQIKYMVEYLAREYEDRALNGDEANVAALKAAIAELEVKLER